jgi:hypothetical protein
MLLCACAANIAVDYDKSTDFSRYRTYALGKGTPAKTPGLDSQIVNAIEEQMFQKGFTKTENDPDLVITYHAAAHEEIDYNEASYASGYGPAYGAPVSASRADAPMIVRVGTIVVDMYDPLLFVSPREHRLEELNSYGSSWPKSRRSTVPCGRSCSRGT